VPNYAQQLTPQINLELVGSRDVFGQPPGGHPLPREGYANGTTASYSVQDSGTKAYIGVRAYANWASKSMCSKDGGVIFPR